MRQLYKINVILLIINLVLYLTLYLGMLFSILVGVTQIIMSIIIAYNFKTLTKKIKMLFTTYLVFLILLTLIALTNYFYLNNNYIVIIWFVLPILLAIYHTFITFKISKS